MNRKKLSILLIFILLLSSCSTKTENKFTNDNEKLNVYASFYPMKFLASKIGEDKINLQTIVPEGIEPHDYEPSIDIIKNLEIADIFIYNGLGLEPWAESIVEASGGKNLSVLNSSEYIDILENDHGVDPHIWLDPNNMIKIGEKIKDLFIEKDNLNKDIYIENYNKLKKELEELDSEYENALANKKNEYILVSHEAFSYMAAKYNFKQLSVAGISPEEEPSAKNIANLIELSKENNFKYIFLETLTNSKAVDLISEEAGLEILVLNPIEGLTEEDISKNKDYISIMYDNLEELKKALVM